MPVLLLMLVGLLFYSLATGAAGEAVRFIFSFTRITAHGVLEAMGHAFFTLSLGMGVMATYGSYVSRDVDLGKVALTVTILDTAIAFTACLILYPMIFAYDLPIAESIGIIFTTLPFVFQQIPLGDAMAAVFFLMVAFAALTSTISLLEVVVAFGVDELGLRRRTAALSATFVIFLFGVPSALCNGAVGWLSRFRLLSKGEVQLNWLDSFDYLVTNWMLPLGGLLIALFVGWVLPRAAREDEFGAGERTRRYVDYRMWSFVIQYISPLAVLIVMLYKVGLFG